MLLVILSCVLAECLSVLDRTNTSGAAAACDIFCNRALMLLHHSPTQAQAAAVDASYAIDCNKMSSKVNQDFMHVLSSYLRLARPLSPTD